MNERYHFFKDQYFFELERKQNIHSNLPIPIGFLTIAFSAYAYFGINLHLLKVNWTLIPLVSLILISIYFCLKSCSLLHKLFFGLDYQYVPDSLALRTYERKKTEEFQKEKNPEKNIDLVFFDNLKDSLANCTSTNRKNNNFKATLLYKLNVNNFYLIIIIITAAIFLFLNSSSGNSTTY